MAKIRLKIQQKLQQRLGQDMGDIILNALQDTQVKKTMNVMLLEKKISLVDEATGEQKYEKEIVNALESKSPEPGDHPEEESKELSPEREPGHARNKSFDDGDCSPERKTKTKLKIGNKEI